MNEVYYIAIYQREPHILCRANRETEIMFVRYGFDVWHIYPNEDLETQINIIVEHYSK